jgi:hypothetical protein
MVKISKLAWSYIAISVVSSTIDDDDHDDGARLRL